ncbi:MAG: hypothetical protein IPK57_05130 [Chitinophagaceae bacterium]|nr:hypothetical protein [Chitinophagaceae bacterium]
MFSPGFFIVNQPGSSTAKLISAVSYMINSHYLCHFKKQHNQPYCETSKPEGLQHFVPLQKDNEYAQRAAAFVREHFTDHLLFEGGRKDKLPRKY